MHVSWALLYLQRFGDGSGIPSSFHHSPTAYPVRGIHSLFVCGWVGGWHCPVLQATGNQWFHSSTRNHSCYIFSVQLILGWTAWAVQWNNSSQVFNPHNWSEGMTGMRGLTAYIAQSQDPSRFSPTTPSNLMLQNPIVTLCLNAPEQTVLGYPWTDLCVCVSIVCIVCVPEWFMYVQQWVAAA